MTEDEAKTKWCPEVRLPHDAYDRHPIPESGNIERFNSRTLAVNRDDNGSPKVGACCLASACMMWRWENKGYHNGNLTKPHKYERGWCGLAGVPTL